MKFISNIHNNTEELYNLQNDPTEENNLIDSNPEISSKLREEMNNILHEGKLS